MESAPIGAAAELSPSVIQALLDSGVGAVLAFLLAVGGVFFIIVATAAGFSWLRRYEAKPHELPKRLQRELNAIRDRVARLEEGEPDVTELAERLEFVERLLDLGRGGPQLPPPEASGPECRRVSTEGG